jgi:hypothetical protein
MTDEDQSFLILTELVFSNVQADWTDLSGLFSAIDFYHVSEIMKSVNLLKKWVCLSWRCYQRERQAAKAGRRREAL